MVRFKSKGNFKKLNTFFEKALEGIDMGKLDKYGRKGVEALSAATPIDTGLTAASWMYEIVRDESKKKVSINFINTNVKHEKNYDVCIAIILQYGHGTKNGGWVEGIDYINPAIQPIFNKLADDSWKEVIGA